MINPRVNTMRLLSFAIILHIASAVVSYSVDLPTEAVEAFKSYAVNRQSALSNLSSLKMKATLVVTEYVKDGTPKLYPRNIEVIGKGDKLKEIEEVLNEKATRIYYLTPKKIVEVASYPGDTTAKMFTLGTEPQYGLFNCPAFLEDSSLFDCSLLYGAPALVPSALASKDRWNGMISKIQKITFAKDGTLHAEIKGDKSSSAVDLIKLSGANSGYRVRAISFFDDQGIIERKLEVLDTFHDKVIGDVGKTFRLSFYHYGDQSKPSHIWDLVINEIQINGPVDAEALDFDPATVGSVYYGDYKSWINVPKSK